MGKIDVYIRSIERFGAAGAILSSGQAVTLRFPTGDRHATQVTPHDQLVTLVREVAPPAALSNIDNHRPARFEIDAGAARYQISVAPKPGAWQVLIEPATVAPPPAIGGGSLNFTPPTQPPVPHPHGSGPKQAPVRSTGSFATQPPSSPGMARSSSSQSAVQPIINPDESEMYIERGQYDAGAGASDTSSGSALLDLLTQQARSAGASDVYLSAGAAAAMRVSGQLVATSSRSVIDADLLARELGVVAPPETREQWHQRGTAMFTYGDGLGRVRVTLTRDHRGPGASLRLLVGDPPTLEQLGLGEVEHWLEGGGLVLIGGRSGVGKTTTLAAMVRWLGENRRRVVTVEDPIEIVHVSPLVSQRAVHEHVPSLRAGVEAAMQEGADAIVVGAASNAEAASAVIEAAIGGHLVLTTVVSPIAQVAADRLIDRLPADEREGARAVIAQMLLGTVAPMVGLQGDRTFEVATPATFGQRQ